MTEIETGNGEVALTLKRKRIMIYFIEATEKLIRSDGVEGLSIRKIASEAGYNSATLYNYFEDLEHLVLFGSVCYLREYIVLLGKSLKQNMTSVDRYRTIYHCFNRVAFRYPEIFHNMSFGRYSNKLGTVVRVYYQELFPSELEGLNDRMKKMLVEGSMRERDEITMESMVQEGFVLEEKADITLELIIALHQNFIYEAYLKGDSLNIEEHEEKFNRLFEYILEMAGKQ